MSNKKTLALSVIMKDEADHIDRFFNSLDLGQFDEVIVVDTGSTDNSVELVKAWEPKMRNLKILTHEWTQDFAAARQVGLDACTSEFMMWADLDDVLEGTHKLQTLIDTYPNVDGFSFKYNYTIDPDSGDVVCELWRERVVRCSKYEWKARLHEVLLPTEHVNQQMFNDVVYNHYPKVDDGSMQARKERNLNIILQQQKDDPEEPRTYFYIGNAYMGLKLHQQAIDAYIEYLQRSDWTQEKYVAATRVARLHMEMGNMDHARSMAFAAAQMIPENPLAYYIVADTYMREDDAKRALSFLEIGLNKPIPECQHGENPTEYTFVPKVNKVEALFGMKEYKKAYEYGVSIAREVTGKTAQEYLKARLHELKELSKREDVVEAYDTIRTYLIQNDEAIKARTLKDTIPYTLENTKIYRDMFVKDEKNFQAQTEDNIAAVGAELNDDIVLNLHNYMYKAQFLKQWLDSKGDEIKTIMDIGCNWGWFGFWLESLGYEYVGVDLNKECLAAAEEKKKHFNSNIEFVNNVTELGDRKFDLIMGYDVIEHVEDDKGFLDMMMSYSKKYVSLATPNGCYSRGLDHRAPDGTIQPHLRVYTPKTLRELAQPYITETLGVSENDTMQMCFIKNEKKVAPKVGIFCGITPEPWGPDALSRGVGGSEEAVIHMSYLLKDQGFDVTVFTDTHYKVVHGIEWLHPQEININDVYDVMISWRGTDIFDQSNICTMKKKYVWMHDVPRPDMFKKETVEKLDGIFVLSEYHKTLLPDYAKNKAIISANGIDLDSIRQTTGKNKPHKMVWTSSYLRGLESLLKHWPMIKKEVPDAELHVMYGWESTDAAPPMSPKQYKEWRDMINLLLQQDGVTHHGRISQQDVLEIMSDSGVFPYITFFPEISCISCMKAQATGAIPFTSTTAALMETNRAGIKNELVFEDGKLTNYEELIGKLIDLLKDEKKQKKLREKCRKTGPDFSWNKVADQWSALFRS